MFNWLKTKLSKRQATPPAEQQLAAIAGVGDFTTPLSYREAESYLPCLISVVDFISHSVASLPIRVCKHDGVRRELITDGSIYDLIQHPHPLYSGSTMLMQLAMYDLLAFGNSIIVIKDLDGRLVLEHTPWIYCQAPYREYNAGYRVTFPGGKTVDYPQSQIIHAKIGCSDGGFIGRSPLARNSQTVALSKMIEKATASLWQNGCYPSLAMKTTKFLNPMQREEARKAIISQLGGNNKGKPIFLDADFNLQPYSVNSKDLQQLETRLYNGVQAICMAYKVSPILAGDLRWGSYQNYLQARVAWAQDGMKLYQRLWSELFTDKLTPRGSDIRIELDNSHLLQSRAEKVKELIDLSNAGIISVDDAKRELGYKTTTN